MTFPDAELVLLSALVPQFPAERFVTKLPADITGTTHRVHRISGAARDIRIDRPIVDVDTFALSEADASQSSRAVQDFLLMLTGTQTGGGVIQQIVTINGPRWVPEANPVLTRYASTYEVKLHA